MDVHNTATRSCNMSRIKGKDTKPELKISAAKCRCGSFCLQANTVPGKFIKYSGKLFAFCRKVYYWNAKFKQRENET